MIRKFLKLSLFVFFLGGGGGLLASQPVHAQSQAELVTQVERYLRNLDTLQANFVQRAYNGSQLTGTFYLDRPGKLRFEYNEVDDFIVADGLFIYFYDGELKEQTNAPIGQTLADFLLRKDLRLTDDITVMNISQQDGLKIVELAETQDAEAGYVRLFFTPAPFELQKWQVVDAAGLTTEIALSNMQKGVDLPSTLFAYIAPKDDKPRFNQ